MIKSLTIIIAALLLANSAMSHEMTPSYPEVKSSFISGVSKFDLTLFNRRKDISFYQIEVFSDNWDSIPYATVNPVISINYLQKINFSIFIRESDVKNNNLYICTTSKILKQTRESSLISSRICSKVRRETNE